MRQSLNKYMPTSGGAADAGACKRLPSHPPNIDNGPVSRFRCTQILNRWQVTPSNEANKIK